MTPKVARLLGWHLCRHCGLLGALLSVAAFAEPPDAGSDAAAEIPAPAQTPPPLTTAPEAPPPSPLRAADPRRGQLVTVVLRDGQVLRGRSVVRTEHAVVIELVSGGEISIPAALVGGVEDDRGSLITARGELWFDDANRTRYLYGPSALMLKRGEAYFSQKELLISELGYGITDNFSVVVGALPVLWFVPDGRGLNATGGLKVGGSLTEMFHLGGGLQFIVLPNVSGTTQSPAAGGFVFATATWGRSDQHLSVSASYPVVFSGGQDPVVSAFIATVSGSLRVGKHIALVSENWLVLPSAFPGDFLLADGISLRFMGERFAVDVGGVWVATSQGLQLLGIPIPWLDFTYHFQLGPK
jgi:hypothetical protein